MKRQLLCLILAYFFIYVLVLGVYWAFKYAGGCAADWACVLDEDRTIGILTLTSYMLTPALAIGGFISWKIQHNRGLLAEEAKHIFLAVNNDLKNLNQMEYLLEHHNLKTDISDLSEQIQQTYQNLRNGNLDIYADALVLYEMSNDEKLAHIRHSYHDAGLALLNDLKKLKDGPITTSLQTQIEQTLARKKDLNQPFKQVLRQYMIFK